MKRYSLLLIVFLQIPMLVFCQRSYDFNPKWVGIGFTKSDKRIGYQSEINYTINRNLLCAVYYQNAEYLEGLFGIPKRINYLNKISNFSLLYGYTFTNELVQFAPMAGLSFGKGLWRNDKIDTVFNSNWFVYKNLNYNYDPFNYVGAQLNLSFIWTPTSLFGIGTDVYYNMHKHPDYGFTFSIIMGLLKEK